MPTSPCTNMEPFGGGLPALECVAHTLPDEGKILFRATEFGGLRPSTYTLCTHVSYWCSYTSPTQETTSRPIHGRDLPFALPPTLIPAKEERFSHIPVTFRSHVPVTFRSLSSFITHCPSCNSFGPRLGLVTAASAIARRRRISSRDVDEWLHRSGRTAHRGRRVCRGVHPGRKPSWVKFPQP